MVKITALEEAKKARHRESALRWYHANKKKAGEKNKAWYKKNRVRAAESTRKRLQSRPFLYLVAQARARSKKRGRECDLTMEWAVCRWTGRCEVTGLAFKVGNGQGPFSPSIDRIDCRLGYTMKNCRFVLLGVNLLKHCGTDKEMMRIAKAIVDRG